MFGRQTSGMPAVSDTVHADVLRFFPELVSELGGDPDSLLRRAGIDPECLGACDWAASYSQLAELLGHASAELDCADFGLRLAQRQCGIRVYGPLGEVMRNAPTFGDAIRFVADHGEAHSLAARVWLKPVEDEEQVFVGHDILLGGVAKRAQVIEQMLLVGHLGAIELTGGAARARRVHFRHQPALPLATYGRYFGCEVRFGQSADGIVFRESDLAAPVVGPDRRLYSEAAAYIDTVFGGDRPPFHTQVRGLVMRSLGTSDCTNDHISTELRLHIRVLHRRLRAERTSFQQIKDEVRRDVLLYYLERTSLDFGRISELLGFAEQSVMTRFCNRMFSGSPTIVRGSKVD